MLNLASFDSRNICLLFTVKFCFAHFFVCFKILMFNKCGKCYLEADFSRIFSLQNSIIYHRYVTINVWSAGLLKIVTLEKGIPRGIIGLNYLSKFLCTQWAVWLMYSSSWILVGLKFFSLTNNKASSVFTNLYYVKFWDSNSISYFF